MASPVDTTVKFYREDFPGAPTLNGVAGSLIGLLDACLCTGFGLRSATSLVVAGGVATLTLASDAKNGNLLNSVILVDGVTGALTALNGEQRVTAASSTTLSFATAAADGTAAGTITVKSAPAGWEKKFTGTNKAVFKSLSPEANTSYLWVNDADTTNANVRAYAAMTDVDTGTGAAPTFAESTNGGSWIKSDSGNASANKWELFADARAFYYCPVPGYGNNAMRIGQGAYYFGDIVSYKSGDVFSTALLASSGAPGYSAANGNVFHAQQASSVSRLLSSYVGLGGPVAVFAPRVCGSVSAYSGSDETLGPFPSPVDGGLRFSDIAAMEASISGDTARLRGHFPGVRHVPQSKVNNTFNPRDTVRLGGRVFYAVVADSTFNINVGGAYGGRGFFDITGPWR